MAGVTSLGFAVRNTNKAVNGEGMRGGVAGLQFFNAANALKDMEGIGKVQKYAQNIFDEADKIAKGFGISKGATTIAKIAEKAVNPLLCAASGVRVLKDKDKDKALTEEVCAMGAMFGAERVAKMARNVADNAIKNKSLEGIVSNPSFKKNGEALLKKITDMPKGGRTAMFIAAELLFIGVSVAAFDQGKKFGKFLTDRDEDKQSLVDKKQVDYKS